MLDGQRWTENLAYPETSQTSKNKLSAKVVNDLDPSTTFAKSSMPDARLDSEYASGLCVTQLLIENIVLDFEKPSTKDKINKTILSKHLTAQIQQRRTIYKTRSNSTIKAPERRR